MAGFNPQGNGVGVPGGSYGDWQTANGKTSWSGSFGGGGPKSTMQQMQGTPGSYWWNKPGGGGYQAPSTAMGAGTATQDATPTIQTSINPANIYSSDDTQHAINQSVAQGQMQADPYSALKQFDRPGVSRSAGSLARALPSMAQGQSQAAFAPGQIGLADAGANAQNMLQGQVGREGEGLGLANILARQSNLGNVQQLATLSPLLGYLSQQIQF